VKAGYETFPTAQNMMEELKIAMKVPMKLKARIVPMFLKNGFFFILYPDSNMMGGSNRIRKRSVKCFDRFVT
jgi:hypothetical protein